jgi:D-alanyl-D-alanine dipeptidase
MAMAPLAVVLAAAVAASAGGELVDVQEAIPDLVVDLRYAGEDNLFGRAVYPPSARCYLRREAVERLARVADRLRREDGTRLYAFDCYRPHAVQYRMWELVPKRGYVAPPAGGSIHNRGGAIDLTLADRNGRPLPMPSEFDEFTKRSWHSYTGGTEVEGRNRDRLRKAMEAEGFRTIRMEWWHYEAPGSRSWKLLDVPFDELAGNAGPKRPE